METFYKLLISVPAGALTFMFGGWHQIFGVFIGLWVIDVISGLVASGLEGKISSSKGAAGVAKKVRIICTIAVAHLVDIFLGTGEVIRDSALSFYVINELVSILENMGRAGVPLPPKLEKSIELLRKDQNK